MSIIHPTKEKLIQTFLDLSKSNSWHDITSDMVLETSGITKGSLYHHFDDFGELVETVRVRRFSQWVDESIITLTNHLSNSKSREDILKVLREYATYSHSAQRAPFRLERTETISITRNNPRLGAQLAESQDRLTNALTDVFREAQEKGFIKKELDPKVIAVFVQAYTIGIVVDDISTEPMDKDKWVDLIYSIFDKLLLD
jgi:AcrR family transcriptional regulator